VSRRCAGLFTAPAYSKRASLTPGVSPQHAKRVGKHRLSAGFSGQQFQPAACRARWRASPFRGFSGNNLKPQQQATLRVYPGRDGSPSGPSPFDIPVVVRIDTPVEKDYYRSGGILPYVLAQILA
jgi:hypothetical protein